MEYTQLKPNKFEVVGDWFPEGNRRMLIARLKQAADEGRSPSSLGLIGIQFLRENSIACGQFMYFQFRFCRGSAFRSVLSGERNVRTGGAGLRLPQPCEPWIRHCHDCRGRPGTTFLLWHLDYRLKRSAPYVFMPVPRRPRVRHKWSTPDTSAGAAGRNIYRAFSAEF